MVADHVRKRSKRATRDDKVIALRVSSREKQEERRKELAAPDTLRDNATTYIFPENRCRSFFAYVFGQEP